MYGDPLPFTLASVVSDNPSSILFIKQFYFDWNNSCIIHLFNMSKQTPESSVPQKPSQPPVPVLEIDPLANRRAERVQTGSSILDEGSIKEYGRTYHSYKADSYPLPNDGEEQNRLDLQNMIAFHLMDEKLYWAPIRMPPRRVLDIGTGTGVWAISFAKDNPTCQVIGTDLSEIQPRNAAPNVEFVREDVTDDWTVPGLFDLIHIRFLSPYIADMGAVLNKAYERLQPGGWVEMHESSMLIDTVHGNERDSALGTVMGLVTKVMLAAGRDPWATDRLQPLLEQAGFVDVFQKVQPQPIGDWPADPKYKRIGNMQGANVLLALDSVLKMVIASGMSQEDAERLITRAKVEVGSGKMFGFGAFYVAYGRKPVA